MAFNNINGTISASTPSASHKSGPNKILIILGGVLVIGFVIYIIYALFLKKSDATAPTTVTNTLTAPESSPVVQSNQLSEEAQEIIDAVNLLATVRLDTDFLSDSRFLSLRQTPIVIPDPQVPKRRTFDLTKGGVSQSTIVSGQIQKK